MKQRSHQLGWTNRHSSPKVLVIPVCILEYDPLFAVGTPTFWKSQPRNPNHLAISVRRAPPSVPQVLQSIKNDCFSPNALESRRMSSCSLFKLSVTSDWLNFLQNADRDCALMSPRILRIYFAHGKFRFMNGTKSSSQLIPTFGSSNEISQIILYHPSF